jgi:two-component system sensor histidine kinase YesM
MKIRNKLAVCFLLVVFVPSAIIITSVFMSSRRVILEQMAELAQKNLQSARFAAQQRLLFAGELTSLIYSNPAIQKVLNSSPSPHIADNIVNVMSLDHALDSYIRSDYFSINSIPLDIRLYLKDRPELVNYSISSRILDIASVENEFWYRETSSQNIIYTVDLNKGKVITARKLYDLRNIDIPVYAALLTVEINVSRFNGLLETYKSFPGSRIYVMNEHGAVILTSDPVSSEDYLMLQFDDTEDRKTAAYKKHSIIATDSVPGAGWSMVSVTPKGAINHGERVFTLIVVCILIFSVIVSLLMAFFLSNTISRPIVTLVHSMQAVGDNNFNIQIAYNGNDEFGYLINQYRNMIAQIRDLIDRLCISEKNKHLAEIDAKNAELQALQARINPHFLYNTLDSINLYAIKYQVPVISEMIDSLADLFRYTLSGGGPLVSLDEEVVHTRNYLKLQLLRVGKDLTYSIDIPGELRQVKLIKLVIQPLVENSIKHGFANKAGPLTVDISAWRDSGKTIVRISDNGAGADLAHIERLLRENAGEGRGSLGISNVHRRLQNTFGAQYGLSFFKGETGGLMVHITVPTVWKEGDMINDWRSAGG